MGEIREIVGVQTVEMNCCELYMQVGITFFTNESTRTFQSCMNTFRPADQT